MWGMSMALGALVPNTRGLQCGAALPSTATIQTKVSTHPLPTAQREE